MQLLSVATASTVSVGQRTIGVGDPYVEHIGTGTGVCIRQIGRDNVPSVWLPVIHATGDQGCNWEMLLGLGIQELRSNDM